MSSAFFLRRVCLLILFCLPRAARAETNIFRLATFNVENYLEPAKLEKQLKYADKAGIPFAVLIGSNEQAKGTVIVKDLTAKTQAEMTRAALVEKLKAML